MTAYYNEIDPYAAQWLRNLIDAGHIAHGVVDERSIDDVLPSDLRGFTQCHFFAGVGVWSLALRRAGWSDDRPVWTGSCPCQPFSAAGQGAGFDDERHLWPAFHHLIKERRPAVVLGEQVASKDADPWVDLVCADLEALGYAFGAVPFPSAGVGAPHIRDRLYWVANADHAGLEGRGERARGRAAECAVGPGGVVGRLGHTDELGARWDGRAVPGALRRQDGQHLSLDVDAPGATGGVGQPDHGRRVVAGLPAQRGVRSDQPCAAWHGEAGEQRAAAAGGRGRAEPAAPASGPVNGLWRDADWLLCRDEKWRPVEPGTFPLAHGAPARVGRLRAYGNAINAEAARVFIECVM
ncbi:MAG TPA: DNA cytosine methyltransferase [Acidovorax sp.]|nr:DNA cytosine methyltransferase [Acidovorax sp.]